uniref:Uncharacterized protein n=1 Tax=viral metagenome TaxID=1070528 RepID=A0A6C0D338_9ZZZZ
MATNRQETHMLLVDKYIYPPKDIKTKEGFDTPPSSTNTISSMTDNLKTQLAANPTLLLANFDSAGNLNPTIVNGAISTFTSTLNNYTNNMNKDTLVKLLTDINALITVLINGLSNAPPNVTVNPTAAFDAAISK